MGDHWPWTERLGTNLELDDEAVCCCLVLVEPGLALGLEVLADFLPGRALLPGNGPCLKLNMFIINHQTDKTASYGV